MMSSNELHDGCAFCSCHSPILELLNKSMNVTDLLSTTVVPNHDVTQQTPESVIFKGGTIRPLIDGSMDVVDAIGIHAGKVVASGSYAYVKQQMRGERAAYKEISLQENQTLLPGLIDPHVHIVFTALFNHWVDLGPFFEQKLRRDYDKSEITITLKREAQKVKPGEWLLAANLDPALLGFKVRTPKLNEIEVINKTYLDQCHLGCPVFILSASLHTAYVNSEALELMDFKGGPVPEDGLLQEIEQIMIGLEAIPRKQKEDMITQSSGHIKEFFETASRRGITMLYDAGMDEYQYQLLERYLYPGGTGGPCVDPSVRIGCAWMVNTLADAEKMESYSFDGSYSNIYVASAKAYSDGSNQGLTGYQSEFYCCKPADNLGHFNYRDSNLTEEEEPATLDETGDFTTILQTLIHKGWPLMIHANGDKAVEFCIEAYREALDGRSGLEKRHRIEHCSLLTKDKIDDMHTLGISPSFLIGHVGYWGYVFKEAIFENKAEDLDRAQSCVEKGMCITLHSDSSVTPVGSLRLMEQAITRRMEADPLKQTLNPSECINAEEALKAVTVNAAWQCHADRWAGSLADGHFADLVILAEDPIVRDEYHDLRDLQVDETWKGGIQRWSRR
jgi:predicted amidohydrolase YtcJ